ncbi:hypothetical protein CBR_g48823 [Chara braunii]|uniref:Uncharacterized protein n=1 Tax=Chara braunii TaxID=69332 RepID=A0A388M3S1_CHABU|nr:hypothetical protein CBR_g48823 [Chara braunii]|eukprot:GBG89113.1 hypothetical protein CBR_g48823 [Chara braunii]
MGHSAMSDKDVDKGKVDSLWLAPTPSKRWAEAFFLIYCSSFLVLALGIIVPLQLFERFTEVEYMALGLCGALPCFLIPLLFPGKICDSS